LNSDDWAALGVRSPVEIGADAVKDRGSSYEIVAEIVNAESTAQGRRATARRHPAETGESGPAQPIS
jgi:hypothetical protein